MDPLIEPPDASTEHVEGSDALAAGKVPSRDFDTTAKPNLPGNPLFENPFPDAADPKHSALAPYFVMMEKFRTLAEEYPDVSALWEAEFGRWQVWPLPRHDATVLSEHLGGSEAVPYSPGADLHLEYGTVYAERLIIDAGIKQDELNKILTRDRWLATAQFKASDLWLHAIREFWLSAWEDAEASGADVDVFEKVAEAHGYLPGISTAIGRQVWSLMVTQRKSLKQIVKERQLSTGDEIDATEEPAGWIQSGKMAYVFAASVYFCGVLAARRALELTEPTDAGGQHSPNGIESADTALDLAGLVPHFIYRYGPGFPDGDQAAIEAVRQEADRKLAAKSVRSFEELMSAREQWLFEVLSGAAPVFGRVAVKLHWSADHRRDILKGFVIQAARAGDVALPVVQRFFAPPRAKQLDNALFQSAVEVEDRSEIISPQPEPASPPGSTNEPSERVMREPAAEDLVRPTGIVDQPNAQPAPRRTRGRPAKISNELKERALQVKGGRERAKILYKTLYPNAQQVKNVGAILRHFNRKQQPKAE